jgi:hypothetical protein
MHLKVKLLPIELIIIMEMEIKQIINPKNGEENNNPPIADNLIHFVRRVQMTDQRSTHSNLPFHSHLPSLEGLSLSLKNTD